VRITSRRVSHSNLGPVSSTLPAATRSKRTCLSAARGLKRGSVKAALLTLLLLGTPGCGALLLVGGAGTSAIAFATGELQVTEEAPLMALDEACQIAVETLGYEDIQSTRDTDRARWRAVTAGGDPVDIRLSAKEPDRTEVRIRIGVFGSEGRSRLVLEQIRQSL
jgi:hypothetical protein